MSGIFGTYGGIKMCINIFGEDAEKKLLGKFTRRWKADIKKKLKDFFL
jgi:hypothetical protein